MRNIRVLILTATIALCMAVFPGSAVAEDEIPDICKIPVLFVHGYFAGPGMTWDTMVGRFKDDGCPDSHLMAPEFNDRTGCNPEHGRQISFWVDVLTERTGSPYVNIVAHSMGGLDTRYYIRYLCGYRRVKHVVTLGGAHHGTITACAEPVSCGADSMCRGTSMDSWTENPFLVQINSCDETPGNDVMYTSVWSDYDEIIIPQESSIIDGAENIELDAFGVGHLGVCLSGESYGYVKDTFRDQRGSNTTVEDDYSPCVTWCPPLDIEEEAEPEAELELETEGDGDIDLNDPEPDIDLDPDPVVEEDPELADDIMETEAVEDDMAEDMDSSAEDESVVDGDEPENDEDDTSGDTTVGEADDDQDKIFTEEDIDYPSICDEWDDGEEDDSSDASGEGTDTSEPPSGSSDSGCTGGAASFITLMMAMVFWRRRRGL